MLLQNLSPLKNATFCPISVSGSNFNPQNTQCIPLVETLAFLELEQKLAFFKGLNLLKKILLLSALASFAFFYLCGSAQAEALAQRPHNAKSMLNQPDDKVWHSLQTKYAVIYYRSIEDLKKINGKVNYSTEPWSLKRLFCSSGSDTLIDKLKKKVDALYKRIQEILDMRGRTRKVNIKIYRNRKELNAAYYNIYKKPSQLRAYYIHELDTIYLNANDIHEGILAHEMAHSIIDSFLLVCPPRTTAEILACYVDGHL